MQNPRPLPDSTLQQPPPIAAQLPLGWLARRWRRWLDLCQRAEQRISENFRVPPGGG
ncbi:hypothetical protein [Comamonas squillarum]|uniref:Uncharacterized protein n=1 Tax=Comamonas squillarum TaxID=2977320 RepID=A0ABY5ZXR7_9BURK|nr:hypothetical protein [Comamonas sp. PR12]UXC18258.1 hypothetical protein N4T19_21645 [Comamonas sp. PR12]